MGGTMGWLHWVALVVVAVLGALGDARVLGSSRRFRDYDFDFSHLGEALYAIGDLAKLFSAFEQFHQKTCIRFVPRTKERDYVVIEGRSSGCWSAVGRMGGRQVLNLQRNGCLQMEGTIVHELMHALGFLHEHTRHDRDRYVNIFFRNVRPNLVSNFGRESESQTTTLGMPYDYGSVMHYSRTAFSKNGKPTVEPKIKYSGQLGQRVGFSVKDVQKINKLYCHR
uniref:Metalloendopeptidase n=1 Tax=Anopheles culicifacies TaxID=139723 RepID=A0A182MEZ6_9DIPT